MNLWEIDWFERNNGIAACYTLLQQMMDQERQMLGSGNSQVPTDYLLLVPPKVYQEMTERNHEAAIRKVLLEANADFMRGRGYSTGGKDILLVFAPSPTSRYDCEALLRARMTVIAGREATDSFTDLPLGAKNVIIGRRTEISAITIPPFFNKVSREHLKIDYCVNERKFLLTNQSERSLTEVNKQILEPHQQIPLADNTKIVIGADEHALMFHWKFQTAHLAA